MASYPRITGWGRYVPERVLPNLELEHLVNTSDEWIRQRTGIRERRIAGEAETGTAMAIEAGAAALRVANLDPAELDLVIAATTTPDWMIPACASQVQHGLGAGRAGAFDVNAACSGFIYGLTTASQFIATGAFRNILVVATEVLSRIVNWEDRNTCVLFGDGAGAVVVQASDEPCGVLSFVLGSDGGMGRAITFPGPRAFSVETPPNGSHYLAMNGPEVFRFGVNAMVSATQQTLSAAGLTIDDIDLLIPHQANERIIQAVTKALGIQPEKVFMNISRYGNTSAASIPIALCEAREAGRIRANDLLAMVGVGGGLAWGAMVFKW